MKITHEEYAPLLSLKRITAHITFTGKTPSYEEVTKSLAEKKGTKPELVQIKHLYNDYRSQSAEVIANVYDSEKALTELKDRKKPKKGAKKEEKKEE
ncbi:MAG: hypothetical protein WC471_00240 [Candidatus Woesearchaeota archaeon]